MTDAIVMPTHPQFKNLEGQTFGRLTVISYAGKATSSRQMWNCLCSCGCKKLVAGKNLLANRTQSCGCIKREALVKRNKSEKSIANLTTHGKAATAEYKVWQAIFQRCCNPRNTHYRYYGARGIRVCDRWKSFDNFFADMGHRPSKHHSIERLKNSKGYEPNNCCWATRKEQQRNTRRTRMLTRDGKQRPLTAWAEELGLCKSTIHSRLARGDSDEDALRPV